MMNLPSFASSIRLVGQMLLWGGWLVPALLAWQRLLDYLNDDLARLHFTPSSALMPMPDINEAANIAAARQWMLVAAVWLGATVKAAMATWCIPTTAMPRTRAAVSRHSRERS